MDTVESVGFNWQSRRAARARVARRLDGVVYRLLVTGFWLLTLSGIGLLVLLLPLGWLLLSGAMLCGMLAAWYKGDLQPLIPAVNPQSIDDILARDILGQLPKNPTPHDIATAIGTTEGGLFFAARFGITAGLLQNIAPDDETKTPGIWHAAWSLRQETGVESITAGYLIIALLRSFDGHEQLLAQLQLAEDDLIKGLGWQRHILELIEHQRRAKRTGGIARDWAFGYIPLLTQFGQNISEQIGRGGLIAVQLESHTQALDELVSTFSAEGRQNAVLVGPTGVGKTSIVQAFAAYLLDASAQLPETLQFRQVFLLDAAALLAAAPGRGQLEKLIMQVLSEAYSAKNVIICLDNAELFFEEGIGSVDLTNVLLPVFEAGHLRMILTMDEQRFLKIGQRNPALVNALNRISIGPASKDETVAVMQDQLIITEFERHVTFTYQGLLEVYRLSERYVHDLALPGRAVKLMETAAGHAENGLVTVNSVQQAIESTLGVKVGVAKGELERETLLNLETRIHEHMINQTQAVTAVSDALRRARAGVRNEDRPIGTFLFLGPTGVGKTELAKALAEVYFGGEDRMIRLDLNEYVTAGDVSRLIANGADDPMSLTARVMKQPFSVVLLDEIEKAHPSVLTTLLQLLDEGILRDVNGREVSFRDAIIIATSNAGADRIREYIDRGWKLEQFQRQFIDELINTNQFKPEFLNRFDEIVLFRPLEKTELLQVVDLMLSGINQTLSLQKITVEVAQDAKELLVEKGYDPRLGARPLRRAMQRVVENTVAKQMLSGNVAAGSTVQITLDLVSRIFESQGAADAIASGNIARRQ